MNMHVSQTISPHAAFRADTATTPPVDPIFDMIENHRREHAAHRAACDKDNQREMDRARETARTLAMALVKAPATTLPGLIALLQYGHDFVQDGNEWPNWIENAPFDWSAHLNLSAAQAIEKIAR